MKLNYMLALSLTAALSVAAQAQAQTTEAPAPMPVPTQAPSIEPVGALVPVRTDGSSIESKKEEAEKSVPAPALQDAK